MTLEIINICLIIFTNVLILFISLLFISYSNINYNVFTRRPFSLFLMNLFMPLISSSFILEVSFKNNIHHLILFNLRYIGYLGCVSIYVYRGFIFYFDYIYNLNKIIYKNKKIYTKIKLVRDIIISINMFFLLFIVFINIKYYSLNFYIQDWQYYPFWIVHIIYLFLIHPLIIFLLNKIKYYNNNIKYDYILSMLWLSISFIIYILLQTKYTYYKDWNHYFHHAACMLTCFSYSLPLLNFKKIKNNVNYENNNKISFDNYFEVNKEYSNFIKNIKNINNIKKNNKIYEIKYKYIEFYEKHIVILKQKENNHLNEVIKKIELSIDNNEFDVDLFNNIIDIIYSDFYEYRFIK